MAETILVKPVITSGKSGHVDGLILMAAVGEFPTAEITFHLPNESISKAVPQDVSTKMSETQNAIYSGLVDDFITIEDGLGNVRTFEGYVNNGSFSLLVGQVGYRQSLLHKSALVNNLQTGIYLSNGYYRDPQELPKGQTKYTSWLKVCLDDTIKYWQESLETSTSISPQTRQYMNRVHGENAEPKVIWDSILDSSEDENEYLLSMIEDSSDVSLHTTLCNFIRSEYSNALGGFNQTIQTFGSQFQIKYVPSIFAEDSSPYGKFVLYEQMVGEGESKDLGLASIAMQTCTSDIIPVGQVAVHGIPATSYRESAPEQSSTPPEVAFFPEEGNGFGRSIKTMAPSWLPINLDMGSTKGDVNTTDNLNSTVFKQTAEEKLASKQKVVDTVIKKTIVNWAKNMYVDLTISGAKADVAVKLDLSWELGRCYSVQSKLAEGGSVAIFTGFLAVIVHTVNSNPSSPVARTNLQFTHVRASGFTLPGLQ